MWCYNQDVLKKKKKKKQKAQQWNVSHSLLPSMPLKTLIDLCVCVCVSQPGPGTECCVCRSWASTTWRSCQLICLMTPSTSARHLMPPWGPGGPNSPSSVCLFARTQVRRMFCERLCVLTCTLLSLSSPTRRPGDRWGSGGAAECGRVLQLELCVSRG